MTAPAWQRVKGLLAEALDRDGPARAAFLDAECGEDYALRREVETLLAAHEGAGAFLDTPAQFPQTLNQLGPYRIERVLAEGGMGTVYEAVRDEAGIRLRVAIKVVRWGLTNPKLIENFRVEQQILARLAHPGIARLIDWGETPDARRYVVMEFVEGIPVDAFCEQHGLNIRRRLELFLQILDAVAYAHQNFVAHGDIKPSNILVTPAGHAKLLDFGIARLLNEKEDAPAITQAFTPAYASPGQLRKEPLTVASDLYALGVLLCRILSGGEPHQITGTSREEMLAELLAQAPRTPSMIAPGRGISRELDAIVLKAMAPDAALRYRTVNGLMDDVRAYLDCRVVKAYSESRLYRIKKSLSRNRTATAAGVLLFAALTGGVGAALWQGHIAQRRFDQVRNLARYVVFDLNDALAEMPQSTGVRAQVVKRAIGYLDQLRAEGGGDEELRLEVAGSYLRLGDVQGRPSSPNLGDTAGALESYRKAIVLFEDLTGGRHRVRAQSQLISAYMRYSAVLKAAGDFHTGLEHEQKALEMNLALLRAQPRDSARLFSVAYNYTLLGATLWHLGRWDEALTARRKSLELYRQVVAADPESAARQEGLAVALNRVALAELQKGNSSAAIQAQSQALDISRSLVQKQKSSLPIRRGLATSEHYMGYVLTEAGQPARGRTHLETAVLLRRQIVKEDPRDVRNWSFLATHQWQLARCLLRLGNRADALGRAGDSLALRQKLSANDPMNAGARAEVAQSLTTLGDVYAALGEGAKATSAYREAAVVYREVHAKGQLAAIEVAELDRVSALLKSAADRSR
ncbi:MAG: serine/threonine-protein kinase [Bryobacteraceae bacterium]|nr:serine/threonine-protein kinase [Bryobacteraceae bacterium]